MRKANTYFYMSMFCKRKYFDLPVAGMRVYCRNMYTTLNDEKVLKSLSAPMFFFSSRRQIRVNRTCRGSPHLVMLFPTRTINSSIPSVFLLAPRRPELS